MKVKSKENYLQELTKGKCYPVIRAGKKSYTIINDLGERHYYHTKRFRDTNVFIKWVKKYLEIK